MVGYCTYVQYGTEKVFSPKNNWKFLFQKTKNSKNGAFFVNKTCKPLRKTAFFHKNIKRGPHQKLASQVQQKLGPSQKPIKALTIMVNHKRQPKHPKPDGINFHPDLLSYAEEDTLWESLPEKVQQFLTNLHYLGLTTKGMATVYYHNRIKTKHNELVLSIQFNNEHLFTTKIFANQIIEITHRNRQYTSQEFIEKMFKEAKTVYENINKPLNRSILGRYTILNLWKENTYPDTDKATLANSTMSLESLVGFIDENIDAETILGFQDLPDSWVEKFFDTKN